MTNENQTNVLETLVGDGKKFKTPEDLAKGKVEADAFILTLQNQIKLMTEEVEKLGMTADRKTQLENLMSSLTNTTNNGVTPPANQPQDSDNQRGTSLSHDDVVKIVEAREAAAAQGRNLAVAMSQFAKVYGEKSDEALAKIAKGLNMSVESLQDLAKQSPQAFLNVVGANSARDNTTRSMANHSSTSTTSLPTGGDTGVRNKAYYDNLQKTMGAWKFATDSKIQVQLHKDMRDLGDAWDA
jgi:hypothetical protein